MAAWAPVGPAVQVTVAAQIALLPVGDAEWHELNRAEDDMPAKALDLCKAGRVEVLATPQVLTSLMTPAELQLGSVGVPESSPFGPLQPIGLRFTPAPGPDGALLLAVECTVPALAVRATSWPGRPAEIVSVEAQQTANFHVALRDGVPVLLRGLCLLRPRRDPDIGPSVLQPMELLIVLTPRVTAAEAPAAQEPAPATPAATPRK